MSAISRVQATMCVLAALVCCSMAVPAMAADISDADAQTYLEATQVAFRNIAKKVDPAVVSITTRLTVTASDNPLDLLMGGQPSQPKIVTAAGSGVIIRPEGIVLTNNHVVQDAQKVMVTLSDSDKELPAEVVQTDAKTDLAILRITEKGTYPTATFGDASTVQTGDWAIAFGNPYRLATTMTVGHVSATHRKLEGSVGDRSYTNLLQTDAAINPGNSGGPLVNIDGEVIGIDFMIYSPGDEGGSVGIGFAIPIDDDTKQVIDTLVTGQPVQRGRLGVNVRDLTDAMRQQYGVKTGGVFVDDVVPDGAAAKAGIKPEDIITDIAGTAITDIDQFVQLVERTKPGTDVVITVVRDGKEVKVPATIGAAPVSSATDLDEVKTGMAVTTVTPELVTQYNLKVSTGVLVTQVEDGSPADDAGLQAGDVITRIGRSTDVHSEDDFWAALTKEMAASNQKGVILLIQRGPMRMLLTLPYIKTP